MLKTQSQMRIINEEGDNDDVTQDDAQQKSERYANIDVSQVVVDIQKCMFRNVVNNIMFVFVIYSFLIYISLKIILL